MIDFEAFVSDCRSAVADGSEAVLCVVQAALERPDRFVAGLQERPEPWFFAADDELTVFCTTGNPGTASAPHDHGTWAVLGCFAGAEESYLYRREPNRLVEEDHRVLQAGQCHVLGEHTVHSVMNRWDVPNGVVHVYAGDFYDFDRTVWDPLTHQPSTAGISMRAPLGRPDWRSDQISEQPPRT